MGYRHISNLYKFQEILMFKQLYAMEKIHGTSAHLTLKPIEKEVIYFSGGEKYESFISLFIDNPILDKFKSLNIDTDITIYGEAYGGKQQRMSKTYGDKLKFIAFEVKIGDRWCDVPFAHQICDKLGIEFVHYEIIDANPELIDKLASSPSVQAKRNGVENPELPREGVVLRPLIEVLTPHGDVFRAKHKNDIYKEREHAPQAKDANELKVLQDALKIAEEWVNEMRLLHVLDGLKASEISIEEKNMNYIIKAMVEDVYREAKGEIVESKDVQRAIGKRTAKLTINYFKNNILDK